MGELWLRGSCRCMKRLVNGDAVDFQENIVARFEMEWLDLVGLGRLRSCHVSL